MRRWLWLVAALILLVLVSTGRESAQKFDKAKEGWNHPMTVELVRSAAPGCEPLCPEWLAAEGEITPATPSMFRQALIRTGPRWLPVVIRSPGGDVNAALEIGRLLREAQLPVGVGWTSYDGPAPGDGSSAPRPPGGLYRGNVELDGGFCNSACPLILAAGTERFAGKDAFVGLHVMRRQWIEERVKFRETRSFVGGQEQVHRVETGREKVGSHFEDGIDDEYRRKLLRYLSDMDVQPEFLDEMAKASFDDINRLSQQRLKEIALITSEASILGLTSPDICKAQRPFATCRMLNTTPVTAAMTPTPAVPKVQTAAVDDAPPRPAEPSFAPAPQVLPKTAGTAPAAMPPPRVAAPAVVPAPRLTALTPAGAPPRKPAAARPAKTGKPAAPTKTRSKRKPHKADAVIMGGM